MKRTRFLILTQYYPPEVGAAQIRLSSFASELQRAGHDVEVITALPNYPSGQLSAGDRLRLVRKERLKGIPVTRLWLYPATGTGFRRLASYLSFAVVSLAGTLVARRRPDIIFVESPPLFLGLSGWAAAKRFRCRLVLNVSDLWPDSVRDLGLMTSGPWLSMADALERWLYQRADAVTAVTIGIQHRLVSGKGVPSRRVLYLPNGVDAAVFGAQGRQAPVAHRGRPRIVYAGNHGLAQGLDVVLDAAEVTREIDFLMVGDGSDKSRLQQRAAARNLMNVRFEPPVPPGMMRSILGSATAGLVSLRKSELMEDARPAKLLAVMACGLPVIYSGEGEGADLVRAADAGIVVPPGDPLALSAAARAVAEDPDRARRWGSNGQHYVTRHLSWDGLVASWLRQLESVPREGEK